MTRSFLLGAAVLAAVVGVALLARPDSAPSGAGARSGVEELRGRVARVVDGDTLVLGSGAHLRLIGIDTPERGRCGYREATAALRRLVEGRKVVLGNPDSVQDRDTYDRLLRYVEVGGRDAGLTQVRDGLAAARYDSRDGYDPHPYERRYRSADREHRGPCGV